MSDTTVVMNNGLIQQIALLTYITNQKNAFVAQFIGESNLLRGKMLEDFYCEFAGRTFKCVDEGFGKNEKVDIVVRPEDVKIVTPEEGMLVGIVEDLIFKGVHYEMIVNSNSFRWKVHNTLASNPGKEVGLYIEPFDIQIMKISDDISGYADSERLDTINKEFAHYEENN